MANADKTTFQLNLGQLIRVHPTYNQTSISNELFSNDSYVRKLTSGAIKSPQMSVVNDLSRALGVTTEQLVENKNINIKLKDAMNSSGYEKLLESTGGSAKMSAKIAGKVVVNEERLAQCRSLAELLVEEHKLEKPVVYVLAPALYSKWAENEKDLGIDGIMPDDIVDCIERAQESVMGKTV